MRTTALADVGHSAAVAVELERPATPRRPSGERVDMAGAGYFRIFTPTLLRSVEFYSRLFGLSVVEVVRHDAGRAVLMAAGQLCLAIHEPRSGGAPAEALRWSFVVDDFDEARASIWDLGIVPVRDCAHEPSPDRPWRRARSLVVRDPGGNEIEIVERQPS